MNLKSWKSQEFLYWLYRSRSSNNSISIIQDYCSDLATWKAFGLCSRFKIIMLGRRQTIFLTPYFQFLFLCFIIYVMNTCRWSRVLKLFAFLASWITVSIVILWKPWLVLICEFSCLGAESGHTILVNNSRNNSLPPISFRLIQTCLCVHDWHWCKKVTSYCWWQWCMTAITAECTHTHAALKNASRNELLPLTCWRMCFIWPVSKAINSARSGIYITGFRCVDEKYPC